MSRSPRSSTPFKVASKHSHKMASRYNHHLIEDDAETFTITNGWEKEWTNLTKAQLLEIPWMKEAIEGAKGYKLFIDDCLGFDIKEIDESGVIRLVCGGTLRIARNTVKPCRLQLTKFYRNEEGIWETDPNYPRHIHCATVSANYTRSGPGCFTDGPKKYYYEKNGTLSKYQVCFCYEDNEDGYCYCYDSDY